MRQPVLLAALATATAVSGVGWAVAATDPSRVVSPASGAVTRAAGDVVSCDGGRQKSVRTRASDKMLSVFVGQDPQPVPGTSMRVRGPARGKDTFILTFSGEAGLWGGFDIDEDYLEVQVLVDGKPVGPDLRGDGDTVLTGVGNGYSGMRALQSCVRLGPGRHTVKLIVALRTGDPNAPVTGTLDDYLLRVERFD